jgi:hypothetical protein
MNKFNASIVGAVAVTAAALIIAQHQSKSKLEEENRILLSQRDQPTGLVEDHTPLSNGREENKRAGAGLDQPTRDLLRLRGEVARLGQNQSELEALRKETEKLRQEIRLLRGPSLREQYGWSYLDTNSIPEIELGATREEVLTELRRVDSRILGDEDKFVHAEIFPMAAANTSGGFAKITMELYFEDGKLTTRKDLPVRQQTGF